LLDRLLERDVWRRQPRQVFIEGEILTERQADRARELQLRFLELVRRCGRALSLPAQLHFGAQHVDAGDQTVFFQIHRLIVEGLCRLLLGPRRLGAGE
jgi:hypothetical protein